MALIEQDHIAGNNTTVQGGSAEHFLQLGDQYYRAGRIAEAEDSYLKSISIMPGLAVAHLNMGWIRQQKGQYYDAASYYQKALQLNPKIKNARRNLAVILVKLKRKEESIPLWREELNSGEEGLAWINKLINEAMQETDLWLAGEYANIIAGIRWGSKWYPKSPEAVIPEQPPVTILTLPKLRHDIGQMKYLQKKEILGEEFTPVINDYEQLLKKLEPQGPEVRVQMDADTKAKIGHVYNRIINLRDTPKVEKALSRSWNPAEVEKRYLNHMPGLIVIDNFLAADALENLRLFCLESTVWSANRYAHGRFGAFFNDGFNCPLLHQISEEIRQSFPNIITKQYPLRQIWGFKNGDYLPPDATIHADFAAINVNFWITPDDANADPNTGGLVVYGVDAPLGWDFHTYNGRSDIIKSFLKEQEAKAFYIPYKQNRAIIFNSDLFHNTAEVNFKPEYENRRINITMLYGDREDDNHHRNLAQFPDNKNHSANQQGSWRSPTFRKK